MLISACWLHGVDLVMVLEFAAHGEMCYGDNVMLLCCGLGFVSPAMAS